MNFFETLLHPDREELEMKDRLVVISAANQLQIGEFQLLQLAYQAWYGQDLPEAMGSGLFKSYMLKNQVPHWARHYARDIIERHERGELDDNAPSFHCYDHDYHTSVSRGAQRFYVAAAGILLAVFGSIYVANLMVDEPTSLLPPYFEQSELPPASVDRGAR